MKIIQIFALLLLASCSTTIVNSRKMVVENYSDIVLVSYQDSLDGAKKIGKAINELLANPSEGTLNNAKQVWLSARVPYLQTEAYRFYEGPIDFMNKKTKESGPESRINAWPLNEAYIDYVQGSPRSGIITNLSIPISIATLKSKNQQQDKTDVATGYHVIEFLLWGQDLNASGPGSRPYADYIAGNIINDRRRLYLKNAAELLIEDLQYLVSAWQKDQDNYRQEFSEEPTESLGKILTGLASMAAGEFANKSINNALGSGNQEDAQSSFSDSTKNDFIYNFKGIKNVYFGHYDNVSGVAISDLVRKSSPDLDNKISKQIALIENAINTISLPYDTKVLSFKSDVLEKRKMKNIVNELRKLGDLLIKAGKSIGVEVSIVSK